MILIGLNGALICNVNDDPSLIRSNASSSLSFTHSSLSPYGSPRRVERLVPPMGFWNTHGISFVLLSISPSVFLDSD